MPALRLELPLSIPGITAAQGAVRRLLEEAGVAERAILRAELVLEEVLMNLLMHGFVAPEGQSVTLAARLEGGCCRVEVEDAGRPFDPTALVPPDPAAQLAEGRIGGLGLVLVHRFARNLHYQRLEGRNRLALAVPLDAA